MIYFLLFPIFLFSLIAYFKVAERLNIVDKPNERSSHTELTIRGGGIIYLVAALTAACMHLEYTIPAFAFLLIGTISFVDDRITVSNKLRLIVHTLAVTLIFGFVDIFNQQLWWVIILLYIAIIGVINAYNFMDGINGITGAYSMVILCSLQYVNLYISNFISYDMIWLPMLGTFVFLIFNFRTKAKCFAGDVGSITVALWIVFLLLTLILQTNNFSYILFLAVYGVDSVLTIVHRLLLKQNIFDAHRLHFYQILANERKMPHLVVTSIYCIIQGLIAFCVIFSGLNVVTLFMIILIPLSLLYIAMKPRLMLTSKKI